MKEPNLDLFAKDILATATDRDNLIRFAKDPAKSKIPGRDELQEFEDHLKSIHDESERNELKEITSNMLGAIISSRIADARRHIENFLTQILSLMQHMTSKQQLKGEFVQEANRVVLENFVTIGRVAKLINNVTGIQTWLPNDGILSDHEAAKLQESWPELRKRLSELKALDAYQHDVLENSLAKLSSNWNSTNQDTTNNHQDCIIWLGDQAYKINESQPVIVSFRENCVLEAFLRVNGKPLEKPQLYKLSGFHYADRTLREFTKKYDGIFAPAVHLPGKKGCGGYRVQIMASDAHLS